MALSSVRVDTILAGFGVEKGSARQREGLLPMSWVAINQRGQGLAAGDMRRPVAGGLAIRAKDVRLHAVDEYLMAQRRCRDNFIGSKCWPGLHDRKKSRAIRADIQKALRAPFCGLRLTTS